MKRVVVVWGLLWTLACYGGDPSLLTVTGQGRVKVKAGIADVQMGVEAQGREANAVEQRLAEQVAPVMLALEQEQAGKLVLGTASIYPEYSKGPAPSIVQYRGNVRITFSSPVEQAGGLIDGAMKAGANRLYGVSLRPAEDLLKNARIEALRQASLQALEEARAVFTTLGLSEKGVVKVSLNPEAGAGPTRLFMARAMADSEASSTPTLDLREEEQTIEASVALEIEFNP